MSAAASATRTPKQMISLCKNEKTILDVIMKSYYLLSRLGEGFALQRSKHLVYFKKALGTKASPRSFF